MRSADNMSARDLRLHLRDDHGLATSGLAFAQLLDMHDEAGHATVEHAHDVASRP